MLLFDEMIAPLERVLISKDEYADLLSSAEKYEMLKTAIYENSHANLFGTGLTMTPMDYDKVMSTLETIDRIKYKEVLDGFNQSGK